MLERQLPLRRLVRRKAGGVRRQVRDRWHARRHDRTTEVKEEAELAYWQKRLREEGALANDHYEAFFTTHFGLSSDDYRGKRVLDIGCGPRGSLEWATMAGERVGADPLADMYRQLGVDQHAMRYVQTGAESMPFEDGHFDIVTSFNSLDHVENVDKAIAELTRVTKLGGTGLLLVEIGHAPTATEPHTLGWDLLGRFVGWDVADSRRIAMAHYGRDIYNSLAAGEPWESGPGLLAARLERRNRWEVVIRTEINHARYKSNAVHSEQVQADTPEEAEAVAVERFESKLDPDDEVASIGTWAYPLNPAGRPQGPGRGSPNRVGG